MEKSSKLARQGSSRHRLPTLNHTKSPKSHLNSTSPATSRHSPQGLKGLRNLYYKYRSNANILQNSPYYTNRSQQKQVVAYIKAHKHILTLEVKQSIEQQYRLSEEQLKELEGKQGQKVVVELQTQWNTQRIELTARSVGELLSMLKVKHALAQFSAQGNTDSTQKIVGFESKDGHPIIDYLLSRKAQSIKPGEYNLVPILSKVPKTRVKLHNFKLVRCLGSGGFSLVYLVRDNWSPDYYALKLIDKKFIMESQREAIIENERFVLGELSSPFVTSLKYCFETVNHFAFVIEYCPGGELFNQLRKVRRMTEAQAKFYFLEILVGLDYIHKKGVIYRDLKPENLLIAADGHVKIADFGLAKPLTASSKEKAYSFCGSPEYMAPQMLIRKGHSFTLDYYCLGALLYQLVLGIPPYYSLDHNEIYQSILQDDLSFPDHTPLTPQLENLLKGLLQKNPAKRLGQLYGIQEILVHPWVGKISKQSILDKQLAPPFLPDLHAFNFDESDLKAKVEEMIPAIDRDLKTETFETVFNREFYYEAEGLVVRRKETRLSIHRLSKEHKAHNSSEVKENTRRRSLPKKQGLVRVQSQTLRVR